MTSKRLFYVLCGLLCLLVVGLAAGTYSANKLLGKKADQLATLKARSQALDQEKASLVKAKKDLAKYTELENVTKAVVPQDKDQAQTVREIIKLANANGVGLASITFPASSLGATKVPGAASPSTPAAPAASGAGSLSQLQPVKNIPGLYSLTITVESGQAISYSQFINFLNDLEHNRRTAQVQTIEITPNSNNRNYLTFKLTLNEYIKP
jgi:hypothetical protein